MCWAVQWGVTPSDKITSVSTSPPILFPVLCGLSAVICSVHASNDNKLTEEEQDALMFEVFGLLTQFLYCKYTIQLKWSHVVGLLNFINVSIVVNERPSLKSLE